MPSGQTFNASLECPQGNEDKRTEQVAQSTLNTNLAPDVRKRAREEGFESGPVLKISRPLENRTSVPQAVSSHLHAPMSHSQSAAEQFVQSVLQPSQEVDPKKFRPSSKQAIEDARNAIKDKQNGLAVSDARLAYARKTLEEYDAFDKHIREEPKPEDTNDLIKHEKEDIKRAWAIVAGKRKDAPEADKKRGKRIGLYVQKFSPSRQAFINKTVEEITQKQNLLEKREDEELKKFAEEIISQTQSD